MGFTDASILWADDDRLFLDVTKQLFKPLNLIIKAVESGKKLIERLMQTPQPPFFGEAVERLYDEIATPNMLEN